MPPRYAYWTIIAGGLPTAFRAADRADLLPTFTRIKDKHADAEMKWFARGRLWDSPEAARHEAETRRRAERARQAPRRPGRPHGETARGPDWRPGGQHRDPRQKYKDAKKTRNAEHRTRKFERRQRQDRPPRREWSPTQPTHTTSAARSRKPRRFAPKSFARGQERRDPSAPPRPASPSREPRPREGTEPTPPPRPSEPVTTPPGPPERGRPNAPQRRERKRS